MGLTFRQMNVDESQHGILCWSIVTIYWHRMLFYLGSCVTRATQSLFTSGVRSRFTKMHILQNFQYFQLQHPFRSV